MKVIFLDIDGPISTEKSFREQKKFKIPNIGGNIDMPYGWDQACVDSLKRIVEATGAKIVMSSDWRLHYIKPELERMFEHYGFKTTIMGYTPNFRKMSTYNYSEVRADEINSYVRKWNEENEDKITSFVAVDDMDLRQGGLLSKNSSLVADTYVGIASVEEEMINKLQ